MAEAGLSAEVRAVADRLWELHAKPPDTVLAAIQDELRGAADSLHAIASASAADSHPAPETIEDLLTWLRGPSTDTAGLRRAEMADQIEAACFGPDDRMAALERRVAALERDSFNVVRYLLQTFTGYVVGDPNKAMLRAIRERLK